VLFPGLAKYFYFLLLTYFPHPGYVATDRNYNLNTKRSAGTLGLLPLCYPQYVPLEHAANANISISYSNVRPLALFAAVSGAFCCSFYFDFAPATTLIN
jgi:hypothetical protein